MKSDTIDLYYFTGTGNTLLVVSRMEEVFREGGAQVNLFRIEDSDPAAVNVKRILG